MSASYHATVAISPFFVASGLPLLALWLHIRTHLHEFAGVGTAPSTANTTMATEYDHAAVEASLEFVHTLCNRKETDLALLLQWLAGLIHRPESKKGNAIVLIGPSGCGKTTFACLTRLLLGDAKMITTSTPHCNIWGNFNQAMRDALLVHIEEWRPHPCDAMKFNMCIQDPYIVIRAQSVHALTVPSYHRWLLTSNVPIAPEHSCRLQEIVCSGEHVGDQAYFNQLHAVLAQPNAISSFATCLASH